MKKEVRKILAEWLEKCEKRQEEVSKLTTKYKKSDPKLYKTAHFPGFHAKTKKEILDYAKKRKTKKFKMTTKDILTQLKDGRCNENLFKKLKKEGFPGLVLPGNRDAQGNTALILAVKLCPSEELYYYLPFDARNEEIVDELQRSVLISMEIIGLLSRKRELILMLKI